MDFPLKMAFPFLNKWMPITKQKWITFKKNAKSNVQMVLEISVEPICFSLYSDSSI